MNLFIYVITGACMGASVLIAQFYGEENFPRLRQQLYVSAVLIGGCTLGAVLLGQIFLPQLLGVIQTPAELMGDVSSYLRIILIGMVFTITIWPPPSGLWETPRPPCTFFSPPLDTT